MKRVAVLGAGLTGACVALDLAAHGFDVDLYDRLPRPLGGASAGNEGKIHLGYVYAMDASLQTARTMLRGAACFRPLLEKWLPAEFFDAATSAPFLYAIPRDSMLPPAALETHYERIGALMDEMPGVLRAPERAGPRGWTPLAAGDFDALFDGAAIAAAYLTDEIAVDVPALCMALASALEAMPRLTLRLSCDIETVGEIADRFRVAGNRNGDGVAGPFAETYHSVVNALWEQRLRIDDALGLAPARTAIHRYKVGLRGAADGVRTDLPNVTFALGEYGDSVVAGGSAYVSWYPAGLLQQETGLAPAAPVRLDAARKAEIVEASLAGLCRLMPGARAGLEADSRDWRIVGGYITAWGRTGIDDRASELHHRHAVGVHSHGRYHSVDTGKLTLAPLFARETVARILAQEGLTP